MRFFPAPRLSLAFAVCLVALPIFAAPPSPVPQTSAVYPAWSALERDDAVAAASMARLVDTDTLSPKERVVWRQVARVVAVQVGDADLLERANAFPDHRAGAEKLLVLAAERYLKAGDVALSREALAPVAAPQRLDAQTRARLRTLRTQLGSSQAAGTVLAAEADRDRIAAAREFLLAGEIATARGFLKRISDPAALTAPDRYRYLSLQARLERLAENTAGERAALEALLEHTAAWATSNGTPKAGQKTYPAPDMLRWWAGVRYARLLRGEDSSGGNAASAVLAVESRLNEPGLPAAQAAGLRLRYAYALGAANNTAAELRELATLPWAGLPDRPVTLPINLAPYP